MKKSLVFTVLFLWIFEMGMAQMVIYYHTHLDNTDMQTRQKLGHLIKLIGARNVKLNLANAQLAKTLMDHNAQLGEKYSPNVFDKKDGYLANSATSMALSLATSILGEYGGLPYMTNAKREYFKAVTMDKAVLMFLQVVDPSRVSSGKRQEIYRLRSEMIREFSKNDREARKVLLFSAAGLAVVNYAAFVELKNKLELVEIVF